MTPKKLKSFGLALIVVIASAIGVATAHAAASYLLAYPKAGYETSSSVFTLKADTTSVDVVRYYSKFSYAHLAYQGTTTFTVSLISGATITSFDISPHSYGLNVTATKSGANLTFSVPQVNSRYLLVRISTSSGALENLFIAADPQETNVPTIGGNVIAITNSPYFADNTGSNLLTSTIQTAINDRSSAGGGTVYFPPGVYKISHNIALKSNVTLYMAAGAVLRGSSNSNDYTWSSSGSQQGACNFVINGNVSNVALKGRGMIDANSTVLEVSGDSGPHRKGIISSSQSGSSRPNGIVIQDITLKDATTWTLNINDARNVTVRNVKMFNDYDVIHNDGYDICATDTATVDNCLAVTGDDCFCAKATSSNPLINVTYMNDVSYALHGAGTKVGDQASGTTSSITFSNIDVISGYRGISISHDQGTASYSNINFNNVRTETIHNIGTSGEFRTAPFVFWTISGGDGLVNGVSVINCYIENTAGINGLIQGDSAAGLVSNIAFQGLQIDGVAITSANYATKVTIGANTTNITFAPAVINSGPPQIAAAPIWVPSPAYAGQTAIATVSVNGAAPFAYQWQAGLNGNYTNLTDGGIISGSTNATLTITGVQSTNALNYVVVITNSLGSITSSVAPLVILPSLPAQVVVQDGSPLTITHATNTAISQSFAVTAGANVIVVTLAERGARLSEPATLTWNGQTLNRTVQTAYNNGNQRSLAIYYLFNPNPGTANITGTMTGATSDIWLTAYTLTGVNTTVAPMAGDVNTGTDGTGVYSLTMNLTGITSGSWAAVAALYANFPDAVTVTGTGSTGTVITDTNYNVTGVTAGYVAGLSPGAISLTTTWVRPAGAQKANFGALVFTPTLTTSFTLNYGGTPIQEGVGSDWNNANVWNPGGLPASASPGSSYELVVGSRLRNPAASTYNAFPGATLTVDGYGVFENATVNNVGEIRFKNSAAGSSLAGGFYTTNYFPNLVLNGGQLNIGDNTSVVIQGQVTAATNSILYAGGAGSTNQTFQIDAYLTGSGRIQFYNFNGTNWDKVNSVLAITGNANTFTGTWDIEVGQLVGSGVNSLGTNTITINTNGVLETSYPINNTNSSLILNGKMFLTQTDAFNSVIINGTPLAAGTYTVAQLNSINPTAFPLTFTALSGTTATSGSGAIKVGNVVVPPSTPHITSIQFGGAGGLTISATNGTPGGSWALLQSTNVALPFNQWQTNATGTFDASGNLSSNILDAVTNTQSFYVLKVQ